MDLLDQVMPVNPGDESDDSISESDEDLHANCPRICGSSSYEDFLHAKLACEKQLAEKLKERDDKRKKRKERKEKLRQELDDFNLALLDLQEFEEQQKIVSEADSFALDHPPPADSHFLHSPPLTVDPLIGFESGQLNDQQQQQQQQESQPLPQLDILEGDLDVSPDDISPFGSTLPLCPNGLPLPSANEVEDEVEDDQQSTPRSSLSPSSAATISAVAEAVECGKNLTIKDKRTKRWHDMTDIDRHDI